MPVKSEHSGRRTIGPLISDSALSATHELVLDAVERGAQIVVGGAPVGGPGSFYAPTLLARVAPGSRILTEEIFGPVLGIVTFTFTTEEEGVRLANATEYGLVAYAHTTDLARTHRLIDNIEKGMLGINTGLVSNASAPFGGTKQSGLGREGGAEGIHEYLDTKYTLLAMRRLVSLGLRDRRRVAFNAGVRESESGGSNGEWEVREGRCTTTPGRRHGAVAMTDRPARPRPATSDAQLVGRF